MTLCLFSTEKKRTSRKLENDLKYSNYLNTSLQKSISKTDSKVWNNLEQSLTRTPIEENISLIAFQCVNTVY